MNDARPFEDRDALASLDRLAAGELDDGARRALFAWLDREPQRWRRCALALLEAREWEGALDDWTAEMHPAAARAEPFRPAEIRPELRTAPSAARFGRMAALAVAASVAIAFGLGMVADRKWTASRRPIAEFAAADAVALQPAVGAAERTTARVDQPPGSDKARDTDRAPIADSAAAAASSPDRPELVPAYVKSQLERRGYRVDSQRQLVSVSLPGGRKVTLPVEKWNLNYIGNRVY